MQLTKTHKIIIIIITLAILFGLYMLMGRNQKTNSDDQVGTDNGLSTTTAVVGGDGYTITEVPVTEGKAPVNMPSLTRKVNITMDMSQVAKDLLNKKIADSQKALTEKPTNLSVWIDLGTYQKMAGDYNGAKEVWIYAGKLSPTNYISFGNLGNLYAYYLKDNAMAEISYKQAITNGPTQAYLYIQLAEVYRDAFKDNTKALAIIEQGLTKIPNDPSLLELKSNLSK